MKKLFKNTLLIIVGLFIHIQVIAQGEKISNDFLIEGDINCKLVYSQGYKDSIKSLQDMQVGDFGFKIYNYTNTKALVFRKKGLKQYTHVDLMKIVNDSLSPTTIYPIDSLPDGFKEPLFIGRKKFLEQKIKTYNWMIESKIEEEKCFDTFYSNLKIEGRNGKITFSKIAYLQIYDFVDFQ